MGDLVIIWGVLMKMGLEGKKEGFSEMYFFDV